MERFQFKGKRRKLVTQVWRIASYGPPPPKRSLAQSERKERKADLQERFRPGFPRGGRRRRGRMPRRMMIRRRRCRVVGRMTVEVMMRIDRWCAMGHRLRLPPHHRSAAVMPPGAWRLRVSPFRKAERDKSQKTENDVPHDLPPCSFLSPSRPVGGTACCPVKRPGTSFRTQPLTLFNTKPREKFPKKF